MLGTVLHTKIILAHGLCTVFINCEVLITILAFLGDDGRMEWNVMECLVMECYFNILY